MDRFEGEEQFVRALQSQYSSAREQLFREQQELAQAKSIEQTLNNEKEEALADVLSSLRSIKEQTIQKIQNINNLYKHNQKLIEQSRKQQKYEPPRNPLYQHEQIEGLSFQVENVMVFDSLSCKLNRLCHQYTLKCNSLKEEIKNAKLKISVSELEYKSLINGAKKTTQR